MCSSSGMVAMETPPPARARRGLVLAQCGTQDARALQQLQPLLPLQEEVQQLLACHGRQPPPHVAFATVSEARPGSQKGSTAPAAAAAAHAAVPAQASGPCRADDHQQLAMARVRQLQAAMVQQVAAFQQLAPDLQQLQAKYKTRQLQPTRRIQPQAVFEASLAAAERAGALCWVPGPAQRSCPLQAAADSAATAAGAAGPKASTARRAAAAVRGSTTVAAATAPLAAAVPCLEALIGRLKVACADVIAGAAPAASMPAPPAAASAQAAPAPRPRRAASGAGGQLPGRSQPATSVSRGRRPAAPSPSLKSSSSNGSSSSGQRAARTTNSGPTTHAAHLRAQLSAEAAEAFQAVAASSAQQHLDAYRRRLQQAWQQQLQPSDGAGGGRAAVQPATVQQVVATLARQDVQPPPSEDASSGAAAGASAGEECAEPAASVNDDSSSRGLRTAAASERLAAAGSLAAVVAAAEEHLRLAAQEQATPRLSDTRNDAVDGLRHTPASGRDASVPTEDLLPPPPPEQLAGGACAHAADDTSMPPAVAAEPGPHSSLCSAAGQQLETSSSSGAGVGMHTSAPPQLHPHACCPVLRAPTEAEVASLPMPSLPPLLDLCHDPAQVLHARLDRVWCVLGTPPERQLDMVLACTHRAAAESFSALLAAWEGAAAAVLQREAILEQLLCLKAALQQQQQQQQGQAPDGHAGDGSSLSLQQVQQVLWAFLAATQQVGLAAAALARATGGQQLLVQGCSVYPPPGAVVSALQLQPILEAAWQVLGQQPGGDMDDGEGGGH